MPPKSQDHSPEPRSKCRLLEIVQYSCELEKVSSGEVGTHCFPFSRIFQICPHRPAVEITRYITIDAKTGEIEIPDGQSSLPKGKPWRDVHLYSKSEQ
ncbi:hypothetical protein EV363DRAFT_1157022 [Boletus edulis]|uniref:Uncharacterized protein n=1 Tax=Boletus edulis BED1 TaxID=1328754 RepID=A0AAD4BT92_BOLED|nr:hypothetical protein EV363DRAFT_1401992 [Boletus edulis]KAF8137062.1 hypothetical protein EV363DRAFT_1157022 [Boletus edulis]KAF8438832.1 hypothetical protein L210DRAFT_3403630 [Boletus edulis BED1]